MKKQVDNRILFVVRILLFMLGATVGWLAMRQVFLTYPTLVRDGLKVAFDTVAALTLGAVLALSARPIMQFAVYVGRGIVRFANRHKPIELVGVLLGLAVGLMIAFFAAVVMQLFVPIVAVRVAVTVVVALIASFFSAVAFVRLLLSPAETEPAESRAAGYILHSSAFASGAVVTLVEEWLNGPVYVSGKTVTELIAGVETDSDPLVRYRHLESAESVRRADSANKLTENEDVARLARIKRLKVIVCSADNEYDFGTGVKTLDIATL